MSTEKELILDRFDNTIAKEIGLRVLDFAAKGNKCVAVSVDRLNHTVFRYLSEGLSQDKHNWIRRKFNVAVHFEQSSLSVKEELEAKGQSLEASFGLSAKDYVAKGGAIPIVVKDVGIVAVITVSGLKDTEDHNLIVQALHEYF